MSDIYFNNVIYSQRRKTAGLSLTEMAIILGIVGLVLGAVWVAGAQVYVNNQAKITSQQIVSIAQNVRTIFVEQGGVTGGVGSTINLALDQMKAFPLDMRTGAIPTGNVINLWDGNVQVYADDCAGNEAAATAQPCFGLTYLNVPQTACIKILSQTAQSGMGLQSVIVNAAAPVNAPISPSAIHGACSANINSILWVFLLKGST
jgi:hypothetical protein